MQLLSGHFASAVRICAVILAVFVAPWQAHGGAPDIRVSDLWDMPTTLAGICNGSPTLFFVCDPSITTCREGAVYFDSRSESVRADGTRPACLFVGDPQAIRGFVLSLDLHVPVYIDAEARVFEHVLDQRVMPVLMLLDGEGRLARSVYGGGESLDHNLRSILEPEPAAASETGSFAGKLLWIAVAAVVVAAIALITID